MTYTTGTTGGRITVKPAGLSTSVTITATTGRAITVYTDPQRTTSVSMPDVITSSKTYYVTEDDSYTISCQVQSIECAIVGGTVGAYMTYLGEDKGCTVGVDKETADLHGNAASLPATVPTADAAGIGLYFPEAHGAHADGATDDTAAILAADAAAQAGGGTVLFQAGKTYRVSGALIRAYTGTTNPKTKPVRWTSNGGGPAYDGTWPSSVDTSGCGTLDLRYDGTDTLYPAKITTLGAGHLEVDHLAFVSGGTDNLPFFQTTNTTVDLHHNFFGGNSANSGTTCVQDAIVFGGTSTSIGNSTNAAFQGYGSEVHHNFFHRIRRGFLGQIYCNGIEVHQNTFSTSCGNSAGGAIEFRGATAGAFCSGNRTRGNTIEVTSYKYGIAAYYSTMCTFGPDGHYDPAGPHVEAVYIDATCQYNEVRDGFRNDAYPLCSDPGQTTTIYTAHQSQQTVLRQPQRFYGASPHVAMGAGGLAASSGQGDLARFAVSNGNWPYPLIRIQSVASIQVSDGVTTSGSAVVTSATAAWAQLDVGMPIAGAGIPAGTFILSRQSATQITMTANATATATGVSINFGRGAGSGTTTDEIQFNRRHIVSQGSSPSAAVDAAAGSGATVSLAGTDTAFTVTLTTGTGPTAGQMFHAPPAINFTALPKFSICAQDAATAAWLAGGYHTNGSLASSFKFSTVNAPAASTTYKFDVIAIQ